MSGKLYLVSTPIGNLKDISLRAIEVLKLVDFIACEDTRHSIVLLQNYDIKSKLIAYHKNNEKNSAQGIIDLLMSGKNVAVISDAGMPVINDPGNVIVNRAIKENIDYTIIPGANAGLCALVLSGYDANSFAFFGFLSEKISEKNLQMKKIKAFEGSRILYSSVHNINKDLESLFSYLGDSEVCVVSEITKMHEKVRYFNLSNAHLDDPKGEFVIVIKYEENAKNDLTDKEIIERIEDYIKKGVKKSDAIKFVSTSIGKTKSDVYNLYERNLRK